MEQMRLGAILVIRPTTNRATNSLWISGEID